MFYLKQSLLAWKSTHSSDDFNTAFKKEIALLDSALLPLQQGLRYSSYALDKSLSSTILSVTTKDQNILVKAGLFYTGIIAGCNCADDPTPVDEYNEYCDVLFTIDLETAETTVKLVS